MRERELEKRARASAQGYCDLALCCDIGFVGGGGFNFTAVYGLVMEINLNRE